MKQRRCWAVVSGRGETVVEADNVTVLISGALWFTNTTKKGRTRLVHAFNAASWNGLSPAHPDTHPDQVAIR